MMSERSGWEAWEQRSEWDISWRENCTRLSWNWWHVRDREWRSLRSRCEARDKATLFHAKPSVIVWGPGFPGKSVQTVELTDSNSELQRSHSCSPVHLTLHSPLGLSLMRITVAHLEDLASAFPWCYRGDILQLGLISSR